MDKGQFLAGKTSGVERDVNIGRGTVRVRALSRPEAIAVAELAGDLAAQEQLTMRLGMVNPVLDEAELKAYYDQPGNVDEVQAIVQAVQELSLSTKEAAKSGVPGVRSKRGT
ncbi:MAG TPA: hypothetical protein VJS45_14985 [Acidimicrobiia bacterium]|nr:hypothetical protein [Acidimicrobiia bacterium]